MPNPLSGNAILLLRFLRVLTALVFFVSGQSGQRLSLFSPSAPSEKARNWRPAPNNAWVAGKTWSPFLGESSPLPSLWAV